MRPVHGVLAALVAAPFVVGLTVDASSESDPDPEVVFAFTDPEILESSGLVARDGLFATVNDSGDSARVFTVDPATGGTVGTTIWSADPSDVEALAPAGDGEVLVGDIGDNLQQRDSIRVTRVPVGEGAVEADAASYDLVYPDGAHDAETLLVHPRTGQVFVVAKEFIGRLFAAPRELSPDAPNLLEERGEVLGIATDGAFFPDGDHLILRDYGRAAVYSFPDLGLVGEFRLPDQQQGEGIAVDEDGEVYVSSEGEYAEVLHVTLPDDVRAAVDGTPPGDAADDPPGGATAGSDDAGPGEQSTVDPSTVEPSIERPLWPWALGGVVGVVVLVVLLRSLRPR